jgi:Uncharacterized protein conserved in bacteria
VNADEIEKSFREKRLLNPYAEFGLQITDIDFATFLNGLGKSWLEKAQHEQRDISIKSEDGILVLSHPSKISFLEQGKAAGFKNYLYFICTVSPEINIKRIHQRVQLGGHDVPEDKVRKRYPRIPTTLIKNHPSLLSCIFV